MSEGKDVGVKDELGVGGAEKEVVEGTGEDGESHVAVEPASEAETELVCGDDNRADGDDKGDGEEESLMAKSSDQPNEVVPEEVRAVDEEGGVGLMDRTNAEMEGTGDGVDENLGERMECEKGSDENGVGEDLGAIASAANGDDSGNHEENSEKGAVSDHVEDIDEAKENIVEEANLDGQGDTIKTEETLSGQVKTADMKHNGECAENLEVRTQIETEEEVEKKMDIDEAEAVQSKEDIELKPLHEGNKMNTEHLTEENGSTKSLVFDFNSLDGDDSGEEDEQSAFMQELENFFKERNLEFKPPKFYGEGLNCLK